MSIRTNLTSRRGTITIAAIVVLTFVISRSPRLMRTAARPFASFHFGGTASHVTGRVVDANTGDPVTSASVLVTGTTVGTTSRDDGTFAIDMPPQARSLMVRRIGYLAKPVSLSRWSTDYEIPLERDVLRLETQVVTGAATTLSSANAVSTVALDEASRERVPMAPLAKGAPASEVVRPASFNYSDFESWRAADVSATEVGRMIVRNGGASIEVSSVDSVIPRVRALATQVGGFVANSSVEGGRQQIRSATLEVRAPAQSFDALLAGLSPLGHVESVNVSAQDVGEEYVDLQARIENDHRLEQRLIDLVNTRTGKLKDVLDVEQELARVREEIDRYQGRLRYLSSHAALSTLSINVHEPVPITAHVGTSPLTLAARQAWQNFIALVAFLIASLGILIPMGAAGAIVWAIFGRKPKAVTAA